MKLFVDGKEIHRGKTRVRVNGAAHLEPALPPEAVRALSYGHILEVETRLGRWRYGLAGSADAIELTARCATAGAELFASPGTAPTAPVGTTVTGTGFFVSTAGHVLTNAHVVKGCVLPTVAKPGETSQTGRIVARDEKNDLALLHVNWRPGSVPRLRMSVRTGEDVATYGFPHADVLPSTGNFTRGSITAVAGLGDDTTMLQISAPVQSGSSGGALVDQSGNVVGVVVAQLNAIAFLQKRGTVPQNVNFAIKASIARTFLESHGVPIDSAAPATAVLSWPDLSEVLSKVTVFITCRT